MGAQYAQAAPATVPQTVPAPVRPAPVPRPPGQVIRPNVPQWNRPPPRPTIKVGKWVGRLGRFGRAMTGIGAFIEGMWPTSTAMPWYDEMPQDDFERALFRKARELEEQGVDVDDVQEWFRSERAENARRRRQQETEERQQPQPLPQTQGARVDEEGSQRRCIVGPYEEIEPICRGNAHHIVPDMAYRLGRRPGKSEYDSTENRIPNAPTLNQGMSICLLSRQHGSDSEGLHGILRQRFAELASPVPGTAPMGAILAESIKVIEDIPDLPEECKALATAMATGQVASKTGFAAPGRTRERPLPSGEAETVLRRGHY